MDLDPEELIELARELRDLGVTRFTVGDVAVEFKPSVVIPQTLNEERRTPPTVLGGQRESAKEIRERMWGPISFPGAE